LKETREKRLVKGSRGTGCFRPGQNAEVDAACGSSVARVLSPCHVLPRVRKGKEKVAQSYISEAVSSTLVFEIEVGVKVKAGLVRIFKGKRTRAFARVKVDDKGAFLRALVVVCQCQ
jgi:hypothetical protein